MFALLLLSMCQTVSCFSFVLNQASLALIKDLFVSAIVFGLLVQKLVVWLLAFCYWLL